MNKVFRIIWHAATRSWVAVSELTRAKKKGARVCVLAASSAISILSLLPISSLAVQYNWTGSGDLSVFDDPANWVNSVSPVYDGSEQININVMPAASIEGSVYIGDLNVGVGALAQGELGIYRDISNNSYYSAFNNFEVGSSGGFGVVNFYNSVISDMDFSNTVDVSNGFNVGRRGKGVVNVLGSGKIFAPYNSGGVRVGLRSMGQGSPASISYLGGDSGEAIINVKGGALDLGGGSYILGSGLGSYGEVNVTEGGFFSGPSYTGFGISDGYGFVIGDNGGRGELNIGETIFGKRNHASFGMGLMVGRGGKGNINVLGGGKLATFSPQNMSNYAFDYSVVIGAQGGEGTVSVMGADSVWMVGGEADLMGYAGTEAGILNLGVSGIGRLTISNGGEVFVGALDVVDWNEASQNPSLTVGKYPNYNNMGLVKMAQQVGAVGIINIGDDPIANVGASGGGKLSAKSLELGLGDSFINFNHNEVLKFSEAIPDIDYTKQGAGKLILSSYSGETILDMPQSGFDGSLDIYGGAFRIANEQALGGSIIQGKYDNRLPDGGFLIYMDNSRVNNLIYLDALSNLGLNVEGEGAATQAGNISGEGNLLKLGTGSLYVNSIGHQGLTIISEGSLIAGGTNTFSPYSAHLVKGGATLGMNGFSQELISLTNKGVVRFGSVDKFKPITLLVSGGDGYRADSGLLILRGKLSGDDSPVDKMVVTGNTEGNTRIKVLNAGGAGGLTVDGIKVIDVQGVSAGIFSLDSPVQAGPFEYLLYNRKSRQVSDGDWYLSSFWHDPNPAPEPIYRPQVTNVIAGNNIIMEQGNAMLSNLHQRKGGQYQLNSEELLAWTRMYGDHLHESGNQLNYKSSLKALQAGHDIFVDNSLSGINQRVGVAIDYGYVDSRLSDQYRDDYGFKTEDTGSMKSNVMSFGAYYTLVNDEGAYLDALAMFSHIDQDIDEIYGGDATQKGNRLSASIEVGKPYSPFDPSWVIEPQAQLTYQNTRYKEFTDPVGQVKSGDVNTLRGRAGVRFSKMQTLSERNSEIYAVANVLRDIVVPGKVDFDGTKLTESYDRTFIELGMGGRLELTSKTAVFGDARYRKSTGNNSEGAVLSIGLQIDF